MSINTEALNQLLDKDPDSLTRRLYLFEQQFKTASLAEKVKLRKQIEDLREKLRKIRSY